MPFIPCYCHHHTDPLLSEKERVSYKREFLKSYQICEELNRDDISWYTKHQLIHIKVFLTWLFDKKKEVRLMSVLMCPQAQKIWQNVKMYFRFSPLGYLWWSRSLVWFIIFSQRRRQHNLLFQKSMRLLLLLHHSLGHNCLDRKPNIRSKDKTESTPYGWATLYL